MIESILLKLPIPGFYMVADVEDTWKVLGDFCVLGNYKDLQTPKNEECTLGGNWA